MTMDLERLDTMVAEGRIIRRAWSGKTDDGRETACLFSALYPGATTTSGCPATDMPQWLADLTPEIDDNTSLAAWPGVVRRYASLARRWHVLDDAGWRRALLRSLDAIMVEARTHSGAVAGVVDGVTALIGRELAGDQPTGEEWDAAAWAAWAARAAAWARCSADADAAALAEAWAAWSAEAAAEAAWDRVATGILSAIEAECLAKEGT